MPSNITKKKHTGVAQVGLVSRSLVANVLGGVVDVLVRLAETGGGDALVRDSLSRHVDAKAMCSLVCSGGEAVEENGIDSFDECMMLYKYKSMPALYTYVLHTQPSASWHLHITYFPTMTLEHRCHTCLGMNLPAPPSPRYSRHRHGDQYALEEPRPEHVWFIVSSHQGSRGFRNLQKPVVDCSLRVQAS